MDLYEMRIMIKESNIIDEIEDFKEPAQNKYETIKLELKEKNYKEFIKFIQNDLRQDLFYFQENLKIEILMDINENLIDEAIKPELKHNLDELMKFENFLQFFYELNLKIRGLIIKKLTDCYYKGIEILKEFNTKYIKVNQNHEDYVNNKINEFNINFLNIEEFDLDFCRKFTIFIYNELEKIININLKNWYSDIVFEPFHLEIFHKVNINSNKHLNKDEFFKFALNLTKLIFDSEIFDKLQ